MDSVASIGHYEFSLLHDLIKLLPDDVEAYNHVYSFATYDDFCSSDHVCHPLLKTQQSTTFLREAFRPRFRSRRVGGFAVQ